MNAVKEINKFTLSEILSQLEDKLDHNICDVPPVMDDGYLPAAVMILLARENDAWNILFTQRTDSVRDHKGQVSFPGGAWEKKDPCLKDTAVRETYEEIGVHQGDIRVFGSMPPMKTITKYYITPFIGTIPWPYLLNIEQKEVERAFLIPLSWLLDDANREEREFEDKVLNIRRDVTFYKEYDGHLLWGITAMLTVKFLELLK
jgi:8-oxo-dGTP pyrophosphatase MutT (NUDIX family)